MSSKEQKTPEGQAPEEIIMDQHEEIEAVEPEASAEQVDPRDEKIANLEAQLAEAQTRERDGILRVKAEMENLRRRTELDIEKAHKFALEKFINELLPVIDSLDRALEVADKANPDMSAMVEGIELTLKSMLDVALDCSGNAAGRLLALQSTADWGRVVYIGETGKVEFEVSADLMHHQRRIIGSWLRVTTWEPSRS
eukprot:257559_1